jgi:hypothetical protein
MRGFARIMNRRRNPMVKLRVASFALCLIVPLWAAAGELPRSRPDKVGMSAERLERIGPAMQAFVDDRQVAGIITALARDGRIVHEQRFGATCAHE